jgi:hypothetical protein
MSSPWQQRLRTVAGRLALLCAVAVAVAAAVAAPGALAQPAKPAACPAAWRLTWQRLADRIKAPVYCPAWLPDPLTGDIGGRWSNIDSVAKDGAYLEGFVWQETGAGAAGGELHVNLRGYPGRSAIPTCEDTLSDGGKVVRRKLPCFADARGTKRAGGITATVYTVNQGADQWHVLYAWRLAGSLYTLSQHVAPPLTYAKVVANLDRELASLELVRPRG